MRNVALTALALCSLLWFLSCAENATDGLSTTDTLTAPYQDTTINPKIDTAGTPTTDTGPISGQKDTTDPEPEPEPPFGVPEDPEDGEFGWPCEDNSDCISGFCVESPVGNVCTETCLENCPVSWICSEVTVSGTDTVYICKPKFMQLCDPCTEHEQCDQDSTLEGSKCVNYGVHGSFCGADCSGDTLCPTGYSCQEIPNVSGEPYRQCTPTDGLCECSPKAISKELATTCWVENGIGSCEGTRHCADPGGLTACDGPTPADDVCDGKDNDCDGITDNPAAPIACLITNEHGSCDGVVACVNGETTCVGDTPVPEICDGLDNDCDGDADEDLCDDGDPCTLDKCLEDNTCENTVDNTLLCDDGDICTNTDKCEDGVCVGYNPTICDDGNVCTNDDCDPTIGCLTTFNQNECDDGDECTNDDACVNGVCMSGPELNCDDGNPCTKDSCDPNSGCYYQATNEGLTCAKDGIGQCQQAKCVLGTCSPYNVDGPACQTGDGDCPEGVCAGGTCAISANQICEVPGTICSSEVPGACTATGECVPLQDAGCVCDQPCNGICICCKIAGVFPLTLCFEF